MQGLNLSQPGLKHDPQWFKKAVFYEVLVRAFADSKGVGAGDFTGLIQRLKPLDRQVILAYDPQTRAIGGVTSVRDPNSNTFIAITDADALKAAGLDIAPDRVTALQGFAPTGYLAVGVN